MSSIKISQLTVTDTVGVNDSLPIARGTQETFRTPASQFVTQGSNIGTGTGQLFSNKTSIPTTLRFRTLSAVGENLAITTTTNTVIFEMSGQTPYKMSFIGNGSRKVWPLAPFNSVNAANYRVDIDGVLQEPFADYSLSANQIIFTDAPYLSGKVVIVSSNVVRLNEAIVAPQSVETVMLRDGCVGTAQLSSQAVTTDKIALSAIGTAQLSSQAVTTQTIANSAITAEKMSSGQSGNAPVYGCRAWVNFDGQTAANLGFSYTRTATDTLINVGAGIAHNLIAGNRINVTFTTGGATNGTYSVTTVVNSQSFRINHTGTTITGAGQINLRSIRASGNVNRVSNVAVGNYIVNFAIPMPDGNYNVFGSGIELNGTDSGGTHQTAVCPSRVADMLAGCVQVLNANIDGNQNVDGGVVCVTVLR